MKPDKKMGLGLLLLGKGKAEKKKDDEEEKSSDSTSLASAKAILRAVKDEDAEALDEALKLHYEACEDESYDEEDDEE